jgi:[acyl-carrier-protein] S-malonyltransferase
MSPVRGEEVVVKRLASEGVTAYVEVGPGTVLTGLVRKIDRGARLASIEDESGLEAIAALRAGTL